LVCGLFWEGEELERCTHLREDNGYLIGPIIGIQDRLSGAVQVPEVLFRTIDGQSFMLYGRTDRVEGSDLFYATFFMQHWGL
jgi:hypothetical protein